MIPTSIRATWSRTCTSLVALGALTASSAFAAGLRGDTRPTRLTSDRELVRLESPSDLGVLDMFQVRVLNADGSLVTDAVIVGGQKHVPGADGIFAIAGAPGQKFSLSVAEGSFGGSIDSEFALPSSSADMTDVILPGNAVTTHSGMPSAGGFGQAGSPTTQLRLLQGGSTCNTPTALTIPGSDSGTTTLGTVGLSGATSCAGPGAGSLAVWYSFTGTGNSVTLNTCTGTNFDSVINVWRQCGTPCSAATLVCVVGNDDFCGLQSSVTFPTCAGQLYKVAISGFGTSSGNYTLTAIQGGASAGPCCPPPPQPTGACCVTSPPPFDQNEVPVACSIQTASDCAAAGGVYQGDDVPCNTGTITFVELDAFPNTPIPDNNPAGITSTIPGPGPGVVVDVNVEFDITHTWVSDLIIEIQHDGNDELLVDQRCGSFDNFHITADDEGIPANLFLCATASQPGVDTDGDGFGSDDPTHRLITLLSGGGILADYDGGPSEGPWTLFVSDNFGADLGVLNHWGLELTYLTDLVPTCAPFDCPPPTPCDSCCPTPEPCDSCCPVCDDDGRVELCHVPPGNQFNAHTIAVGPAAVQHHLDHGDTLGECP